MIYVQYFVPISISNLIEFQQRSFASNKLVNSLILRLIGRNGHLALIALI